MDISEIRLSNMHNEGCIEVHVKIGDKWFELIREVEGGEIYHFVDVDGVFNTKELTEVES